MFLLVKAFVLMLLLVFGLVNGNDSEHDRILEKLTNGHETSALRPNDGGPPVKVNFSMYIDSFDSVSVESMDYTLSVLLSMQWQDPRLFHNSTSPLILNSDYYVGGVWRPAVYFDHEKKGDFHKIITNNVAVSILTGGIIQYRLRITLTLGCYMQFYNYPMDNHTCGMKILSFANSADQMILEWADTGAIVTSHSIEIPQFKLTDIKYWQTVGDYKDMMNRSMLFVQFNLEHMMAYHLLTTYIPSALLVIVSWVSFWLRPDATPARIGLGATTILTTATYLSTSRASLPSVSYVTAIDVWMSTCLVLIFCAMMESALVNQCFFDKKAAEAKGKKSTNKSKQPTKSTDIATLSSHIHADGSLVIENGGHVHANGGHVHANGGLHLENGALNMINLSNGRPTEVSRDKTMVADDFAVESSDARLTVPEKKASESKAYSTDRIARILFPVLFLLFNLAYWCFYSVFWLNTRHLFE